MSHQPLKHLDDTGPESLVVYLGEPYQIAELGASHLSLAHLHDDSLSATRRLEYDTVEEELAVGRLSPGVLLPVRAAVRPDPSRYVAISRPLAAATLDFLREYERQQDAAGARGEYRGRLGETIEQFQETLHPPMTDE